MKRKIKTQKDKETKDELILIQSHRYMQILDDIPSEVL